MTAVGRPTPCLRETEFLFVHPVEVAVVDMLGGIARQPALLLRREIDDVHVAVALLAEHRAVRGQLGCSRAAPAELQLLRSERVDVEVRGAGPPIELSKVRLEDDVLEITRPLESVVEKRIACPGHHEPFAREEQGICSRRGIVDPNELAIRPRIFSNEGEPCSATELNTDRQRALAGERRSRLERLGQRRVALFLLRDSAGRRQQSDADEEESRSGGSHHERLREPGTGRSRRVRSRYAGRNIYKSLYTSGSDSLVTEAVAACCVWRCGSGLGVVATRNASRKSPDSLSFAPMYSPSER